MTTPSGVTLLVDAGNTRFKWALAEGDTLTRTGAAAYQREALAQQLRTAWAEFTDGGARVARVLLCTVGGPDFAPAVSAWAQTQGVPVEDVMPAAAAFGVRNAYAQPQRLGADRWAALVAARRYISGAACIVDCGTALTIDVLGAAGEHRGGIIAPGLRLMRQSLIDHTEAITSGASEVTGFLGQDTQSAVEAGIRAAAAGAVAHIVAQARATWRETLTVVVTGGDAPRLLPALAADCRHEPHWVLQGLAVIARDIARGDA